MDFWAMSLSDQSFFESNLCILALIDSTLCIFDSILDLRFQILKCRQYILILQETNQGKTN